jgi:excisionase family DNA binding protein
MAKKYAVRRSKVGDSDPAWSSSAKLAFIDARQRYAIDEAAQYLRISRARLYQKIAAGEIRLLKDGRRSFIPGSAIVAASK